MSIAYGFATYSQSTDLTLFDTQARADERMYARKKIPKAKNEAAETERDD